MTFQNSNDTDSCYTEAVQKSSPYSVLPSISEASLTSFGTASHEETPRLEVRGDMRGAWQTEFALKKS